LPVWVARVGLRRHHCCVADDDHQADNLQPTTLQAQVSSGTCRAVIHCTGYVQAVEYLQDENHGLMCSDITTAFRLQTSVPRSWWGCKRPLKPHTAVNPLQLSMG
jgi:hypothetical protein